MTTNICPTTSSTASDLLDLSDLLWTEELQSHHHKYYFDDELSVFLVEGRFFKVHRYFLIRESEFFRTLFQLPSGEKDAEGRTDETAIPLHDVKRCEFESFLDFLYEGMHKHQVSTLSYWINILSISTRFVCDKMRDRAIEEIDNYHTPINPVEKIVIATKFDVSKWLAPSYEAVCQRDHPLNIAEAQKLGLATTVLLAQARERIRQEIEASPPTGFIEPPQVRHECGNVDFPSNREYLLRASVVAALMFLKPRTGKQLELSVAHSPPVVSLSPLVG
ncbi:hypothetical protein A0H81_03086 [Grifola frondosa]|uniref:BTB domain-containing protein n=1 Tax=Grifola frondosa TaxID=5627 RepID=A0A1C7MI45_GRIFR|nr:hypothetical protein A0H81_03086 [Grifola frondosa]